MNCLCTNLQAHPMCIHTPRASVWKQQEAQRWTQNSGNTLLKCRTMHDFNYPISSSTDEMCNHHMCILMDQRHFTTVLRRNDAREMRCFFIAAENQSHSTFLPQWRGIKQKATGINFFKQRRRWILNCKNCNRQNQSLVRKKESENSHGWIKSLLSL